MDLKQILTLTHGPIQNEPWIEFSLTNMKTFDGFLEYIHAISNVQHLDQSRAPILFRGHGNSTWDLRPKICRIAERLPLDWKLGYEFDSVLFFKQHAHRYLESNCIPVKGEMPLGAHYFVEWLSIIQHHGAPTRLLD